MPSWKQIRDAQRVASVADAASRFRDKQLAERRRAPANVFISYSSRDRDVARSLCSSLAEKKIDFFLDEKVVVAGAVLPTLLED